MAWHWIKPLERVSRVLLVMAAIALLVGLPLGLVQPMAAAVASLLAVGLLAVGCLGLAAHAVLSVVAAAVAPPSVLAALRSGRA